MGAWGSRYTLWWLFIWLSALEGYLVSDRTRNVLGSVRIYSQHACLALLMYLEAQICSLMQLLHLALALQSSEGFSIPLVVNKKHTVGQAQVRGFVIAPKFTLGDLARAHSEWTRLDCFFFFCKICSHSNWGSSWPSCPQESEMKCSLCFH